MLSSSLPRALRRAVTFSFVFSCFPTIAAAQSAVSKPAGNQRVSGNGAAVRYDIAFPNAAHHEAEVTATFSSLPAGALELRMSRSSPGPGPHSASASASK